MYPTHLMGTVQSGKREAEVKMKRAMSLVAKWSKETQKQSGEEREKKRLCRCLVAEGSRAESELNTDISFASSNEPQMNLITHSD